jgi:hypothetical protein
MDAQKLMNCQKYQKCQNPLLAQVVPKVPPPLGVSTGTGTNLVEEKCQKSEVAKACFILELRPLPGNWRTSPEQRLRAALKCLLRSFGLRAVTVKPVVSPIVESSASEPRAQTFRPESD